MAASKADCAAQRALANGCSLAIRLNKLGIRSALTFDMRGMRQQAKPDVACPLDGRVRRQLVHLDSALDSVRLPHAHTPLA